MDYRYLGRSGLKVSDLCFGAMTFGREADKETSFQMLDAFKDAGGTFIDTANVYGIGTSETILGEWLAKQARDEFVIATKVRFSMGDGPNDSGLGRKHIMQQIDASLNVCKLITWICIRCIAGMQARRLKKHSARCIVW